MGISLKPDHLKRYKDIASLFWKYGGSDVVAATGLNDAFSDDGNTPRDAESEKKADDLAHDLEAMGPIYVKLGQVLSSRADLLPPEYIEALTRLQDNIKPFSFAEVEQIVQGELGVRISKAFQEFESTPIASASLGQVHRAITRQGKPVVVKVQRPNIKKDIAQDLEVLQEIADFLDKNTSMGERVRFSETLDEFRNSLAQELDYRREAHNLHELSENLKTYETIVVPQAIDDFTTSQVLTMDYLRGRKITKLGPLAKIEMNGERLAEDLFKAYLQQVLVDGFFHADPHPGNVFVTEDHRVALLDLGMVGRIAPTMQEQLLRFLIAISDGNGDEAADVAIKFGEVLPTFNEASFRREVSQLISAQQSSTLEQIQTGRLMLEFTRISSERGLRMPPELTMLSKMLLNLDEVGRTLDPGFNPTASIRRNAGEMLQKRLIQAFKPSNMLSAAIEAKEFTQELPGRVNRILDALSKNQLKLNIDAIDETTLVEGFQKVSNRITTGLILAALIIGAAMLMRVETSFRLFGYPGLAILCFLAAAIGGFWLVVTIMLADREARKKAKLH